MIFFEIVSQLAAYNKNLLMETIETKTGQFISLEKAKQLIKKFKVDKDKIVKDEYKGKNLLPNSETFDRYAIDTLLQLPGCTKIRIYFGMEEDDKVSLVIVGVDKDGKDILSPTTLKDSSQSIASVEVTVDEPIVENGAKCPPECPLDSPLNS